MGDVNEYFILSDSGRAFKQTFSTLENYDGDIILLGVSNFKL